MAINAMAFARICVITCKFCGKLIRGKKKKKIELFSTLRLGFFLKFFCLFKGLNLSTLCWLVGSVEFVQSLVHLLFFMFICGCFIFLSFSVAV